MFLLVYDLCRAAPNFAKLFLELDLTIPFQNSHVLFLQTIKTKTININVVAMMN
jgi:hypothetical protein